MRDARPTYLEAEARLGGGFLHPAGRVATERLLAFLEPAPTNRILELGCGPGATTVLVAKHSPRELVALDASPAMLVAARERLAREVLLSSVRLLHADLREPLEFPDAYFDAVYAESVIALVDPEPAIREIARILRSGGKLALNERIWKPHITQAQADLINSLSQAAFGIPAATPAPLDRDGWLAMLDRAGLTVEEAMPARELPPLADPPSALATRLTRYRRYLGHPELAWHQLRFKLALRRHRQAFDALEGHLFFARKRP